MIFRRQRAFWLTIVLFSLVSLACNAFAGGEPLATPPPLVTATAPSGNGDDGGVNLAPTATVEGTGEPISTEPQVTMVVDLNVRNGPGVQYDRVGFLPQNSSALIIGRDYDSGWWKIECPSGINSEQCWVSGGESFTRASNADGVPVAAVPPTPTPPPPALAPNTGLVVYLESGVLTAVTFPTDAPAEANGSTALVSDPNISQIFVSPTGQRIAYLTGGNDANSLYVVNVDGTDRRLLVSSSQIPVASGVENIVSRIGQVQWLADGQTLLFNSREVNLVGPGAGSQQDLWSVTVDGDLTLQVEAGQGGGAFAVSPNNIVVMSGAESVKRFQLFTGGTVETVLTFEFINTASEYIYYPIPQWTADGAYAYLSIPSADQWSDRATTSLWRVPSSGPAQQLETVAGNTLFDPVQWSRNGNVLAHVQISLTDTPQDTLFIANGLGQNASQYAQNSDVRFLGWSPNERDFVFATEESAAVGQIGAGLTEISLRGGERPFEAHWLDETTFLLVSEMNGSEWRMSRVGLDGAPVPFLSTTAAFVPYTVWVP